MDWLDAYGQRVPTTERAAVENLIRELAARYPLPLTLADYDPKP
jgi:hypothetical protein